MIPVSYYVGLSAVLFSIGALGVLIRRNPIVIFMSVELMLNSANLVLVAFAREYADLSGQIFVFFVMTVAAAEAVIHGNPTRPDAVQDRPDLAACEPCRPSRR